ncbi:MAG: ATP-binding cassette domain-containing protein, partial [Planctomycetota bacterium JB042]
MNAPVLQLEGVTKTYVAPDGTARRVLDVRSFRLDAGEQAAMFGASGSGKTTFLHVVAGLVRPDAGRVVVCGGDLAMMSEAERDRHRAA